MKKLITLLVALTSFISFAQSKNIVLEDNYNYNSQVKITSLSYDVDSVTELEEIDWKEIKSIFNTNKEDDVVKLSFAINMDKRKSKKGKDCR